MGHPPVEALKEKNWIELIAAGKKMGKVLATVRLCVLDFADFKTKCLGRNRVSK
jgi:hypothetical protein